MDYNEYYPALHRDLSLLSYALSPNFVFEVTEDCIHINSSSPCVPRVFMNFWLTTCRAPRRH